MKNLSTHLRLSSKEYPVSIIKVNKKNLIRWYKQWEKYKISKNYYNYLNRIIPTVVRNWNKLNLISMNSSP